MYLTKLNLELNNRTSLSLISDCQKMHSYIMGGFPSIDSNKAREDMGILYQVKVHKSEALVYIQSEGKPDPLKYTLAKAEIKDVSGLKEILHNGMVFRFTLFANPAVRKKIRPEDRNSKRIFIADYEDRMKWLNRKLSDGGAELISAAEASSETIRGKRGKASIEAIGVHWEGILKITDQGEFWSMLQKGIGHEKAYGMGMLMLQKY